jgi:hypothetical protein
MQKRGVVVNQFGNIVDIDEGEIPDKHAVRVSMPFQDQSRFLDADERAAMQDPAFLAEFNDEGTRCPATPCLPR